MIKVAITGGIGSGKSLVAQRLISLGYDVFSCDEIYKDIIKSPTYIQKIENLFPEVVIRHSIDRTKLATLIFNDEDKRKIINAIAHPMIMQQLYTAMEKCNKPLVFAEVPLLFEGGFDKDFDKIIVILRDEALRIDGVLNRLGSTVTKTDVIKRIASQFDYKVESLNKYNNIFILENNTSQQRLFQSLDEILKLL